MSSPNDISFPNGIRNYMSYATKGSGVEPIYAETQTATLTTAQDIVTFKPSTNFARYKVGGVITLTSGTNTGTVQLAVDFVDAAGTVHTEDVFALVKQDGTMVTSGTGASTDWNAIEMEINVDNSGTTIAVETLVTGSVNYIACAFIKKVGP